MYLSLEIEGKFLKTSSEYGFVTPESQYKIARDIFIPPGKTKRAFHKDKVLVRVKAKTIAGGGKLRGEIIEVLAVAKDPIIGKAKKFEQRWAVIPRKFLFATRILQARFAGIPT